eukprot:TRINITY_DN1337_c0_g1_i1.p1 TRINITY_DN1337_c0_g1~~TRINITY_DN1337_c0_g1_i1.p1  ORF type:complete len:642 (-),score=181.53 TRINITY_DN1337_c0_g1_i1:511-2346(-)
MAEKIAEKNAKRAERMAASAAKRAEKKAAKGGYNDGDVAAILEGGNGNELTQEQKLVAESRAVTGVLASAAAAMDLKFEAFSIMVGGNQLLADSTLELNQGCRYGLIGDNGSGKSNILASIAQGDLPLPEHVDVFHLHEEAPADDRTGVEAVVAHVKDQVDKLEALSMEILEKHGAEDDRLALIADRMEELDPTGSEPRARKILSGLGFADHLVPMDRKTKHMSGGWRMRVSLAKALFAGPSLLLLDEPTNHLDLEACVWLEQHLATYKKCLLVVSHSQDFLNAVCTHTIWLTRNTLTLYGGNYAAFCKTIEDEEKIQAKQFEKQQDDIQKLETFVRVNRANGVASSAKSKKKVLEKIMDDAVEKPKLRQATLAFDFPEATRLEPPVLPFSKVSFSYSGKSEDFLYKNLDLGIDCDSRIALVGPNGCGKSTLLKLMSGELAPVEGEIKKHQHLSMGLYHQHSAEILDPTNTPLGFMKATYPPSAGFKRSEEVWIAYMKKFGFTNKTMGTKIAMLSGGQKSRLVFAMLAMKPHSLLLLDEPTNHLDVDAVDGLAEAIRGFQGGVIVVSHDFRLIDQVAKEIWECKDKTVKRFDGNIRAYKEKLAKKMSALKV